MMDGTNRPSASGSAYDAIRTSMMSGKLAPGELLIEQTLAEDLELSRTAVREAIRRLFH